jgi:hypothetical protein
MFFLPPLPINIATGLSRRDDGKSAGAGMTAQTRSSSQIWHGIFDRVFRIGEQLVILSVVVAAWEKSHLLILTVFSCVLLVASAFGNILWAINYFEREWIKWLVGTVLLILFTWIGLFGPRVLDSLMLALIQGNS